MLTKYRKVSVDSVGGSRESARRPGYNAEMFPVAARKSAIWGAQYVTTGFSRSHPAAAFNGAEVLIRVYRLHGPVGSDTAHGLVDGATAAARSENMAYVVAANQGVVRCGNSLLSWPAQHGG